jgi:hypothetical protein
LWLAALGCGPASEPPLGAIALGAPLAPPQLLGTAAGSVEGGADLYAPTAVRRAGDWIWLVDAGNDRLVRFDTTLGRALTHGRKGAGPGELRFPTDLTVDQDRILVAESGNGRVSVFDSAGAFQRLARTRTPPAFAAVVGHEIVTTPGAPGFYTDHANGRGHARIPGALAALVRAEPATYLAAEPFIASSGSGPLYVLDASVLAVAAYDGSGRLLAMRLLPEPFRSVLLERRTREMRSWGARATAFLSVPATKRISLDPRGRILVTFPLPDHWGLLIDPATWSARPLPLPAEQPARDVLWSASDASVHGDRLYALSQDRLYQFQVEGWR